jgi:hypothetical protein
MGVDESRRRRDMYEARLGPDDERVELGGWVYYARAVTWQRDFTHGLVQPVGELLTDGVRLAAQGLRRVRSSRRPWIVGVVRIGDVATWNDLSPHVVFQETLASGESPKARIEQLARQAQDGAFAPSR